MLANFGAVLNDLIRLGPGILHDDGKLDLCVFSPGIRNGMQCGSPGNSLRKDFLPWIRACSIGRAAISASKRFRPRPVQADGELLGDTPFEVDGGAAGSPVARPAAAAGGAE